MKNLFLTLTLIAAALTSRATTYYVSTTGDDANAGTATSSPWKSISKVNAANFQSGDVIAFQGGTTFSGSLVKSGLSGVTITSYGTGKAIIASGVKEGIYLTDCKQMVIKNLILKGAGYMATPRTINGLMLEVSYEATTNFDNIVVDNIETVGYGGYGIMVYSDSDLYGWRNFTLTNSSMHDNGMGGILTAGNWDLVVGSTRISNANFYIGTCKAYNNFGRSDYTQNCSGSGIVITGVNGALVEYCEAYENGKDNNATSGGPVGIWIDEAKYVTIQYCISHHNHGGLTKADGGGFDFDGGSYGSVIQFCDSYENEGCGYGFFQWSTGLKWSNDTVRNCTSTNDGRNTKYGAFTFWGQGSGYKVTNAQIYENRVSLDKAGSVLTFFGNNFSNVQIHNNAFCITAPGTFYTTLSSAVTLTNNSFPCLVLSIKTGSFNVKRIS